MYNIATKTLAGIVLAGTLSLSSASAGTLVDVELALLVDVSGSIDDSEFALQRDAYVNAFKDADVQAAMFGGPVGAIAASFVYWSGGTSQVTAVDWTLIDDASAADAFADAIGAYARPYSNRTAPGSAINFAAPGFATNDFMGSKNVIDVSGDGRQNSGDSTSGARDAALLAGIDQVNGLVILGQDGLEEWYNLNVKGGTGSFVATADSFADFGDAIEAKMIREVSDIPLPAPVLMLGAAIGGLGFMRRKRV